MAAFLSKTGARVAFVAAASFLLLLILSAPHRVHHLFDDAEATKSCASFVLSKSCDLKTDGSATILPTLHSAEKISAFFELNATQPSLSSYGQRAPPLLA